MTSWPLCAKPVHDIRSDEAAAANDHDLHVSLHLSDIDRADRDPVRGECLRAGRKTLQRPWIALEFPLVIRPSGPLSGVSERDPAVLSTACSPTDGVVERRRAIPVRRLCARPRPAGADARRRGDRDRTAGLRPPGPSGAESRARRQQGRPAGRGLGRADRLRIDAHQSYQCGAQGHRRQRRGTAAGPDDRPQGVPLRWRRQGNAVIGWRPPSGDRAGRIGRDIRSGAAPSRQALHRRPAVPEHERRPGAGVLRRWRGRGHHHGLVAPSLAVRHRAQLELHLQGPGGGREAGRPRARRRATCWKAACARPRTACASPGS